MKKTAKNVVIKIAVMLVLCMTICLVAFLGVRNEVTVLTEPASAEGTDVGINAGYKVEYGTVSLKDPTQKYTCSSIQPYSVDISTSSGWLAQLLSSFETDFTLTAKNNLVQTLNKGYRTAPMVTSGVLALTDGNKAYYIEEDYESDVKTSTVTSDQIVFSISALPSDGTTSSTWLNECVYSGASLASSETNRTFYCSACQKNLIYKKGQKEVVYHGCASCGTELSNYKSPGTSTTCPGCSASITSSNFDTTTACYCSTCRRKLDSDDGYSYSLDSGDTLKRNYETFGNNSLSTGIFQYVPTSVKISGTDWLGNKVTDKEIVDIDEKTVLAGVYYISSVKFALTYNLPYFTSYTYDFFKFFKLLSSLKDSSAPDADYTWMINGQGGGAVINGVQEYTVSYNEYDLPLILSSKISLNSSVNSYMAENLLNVDGYTATYNSSVDWADRVTVASDGSSDATGTFSFSNTDPSRTFFTVYPGLTADIGEETANSNLTKIKEGLEIGWYSGTGDKTFGKDENNKTVYCTDLKDKYSYTVDDVKSEAITNGGVYYLTIQSKIKDEYKYTIGEGESATDYEFPWLVYCSCTVEDYYTQAEGSTFADAENRNKITVYAQPFEVAKKPLRVDIDSALGACLSAYSKQYQISYRQVTVGEKTTGEDAEVFDYYYNDAIPSGIYKYNAETDEFNETTGTFVSGTDYYVVDSDLMYSAESLFANTANLDKDPDTEQNDEDTCRWVALMKGDVSDIHSGADLFSFSGSQFPSVDTGWYDYVNLTIYFTDETMQLNFAPELGSYDETFSTWTAFTTTVSSTTTYKISEGKNAEGYFVYNYKFYATDGQKFAIIAPPVTVVIDEDNFQKDYEYGEMYRSTSLSMDYEDEDGNTLSALSLVGNLREEDENEYSVVGADDWTVKVVYDESNAVSVPGKNVAYVVMRVFRERTDEEAEQETVVDGYYMAKTGSDSLEKYYYPYNDPILPSRYDGKYYVAFSLIAYRTGKTVKEYCVCEEGIAFVLQNPNLDVSEAEDAEERNSMRSANAIVSFKLEAPVLITVQKLQMFFEVTDISNDKVYDGTATVYDTAGNPVQLSMCLENPDTPMDESLKTQMPEAVNILDYDSSKVFNSIATLEYIDAMAGENKAISLAGKAEESGVYRYLKNVMVGESQLAKDIMNCYEISESIYYNGGLESIYGDIEPLTLKVQILNPPEEADNKEDDYENHASATYRRTFQTYTGVAVRVAKYNEKDQSVAQKTVLSVYEDNYGSVPEGKEYYADYYYYYYFTESGAKVIGGYTFCDRLFDMTVEQNGKNIPVNFVFLEIVGGFLQKYNDEDTLISEEGFVWETADFKNWNFGVKSSFLYDSVLDEEKPLINEDIGATDLIYWYDDTIINAQDGINGSILTPINFDTNACDSSSPTCHLLHLDYEHTVTNYRFTYADYDDGAEQLSESNWRGYAYFSYHIDKAVVDPSTVFEEQPEDLGLGRYLQYTGASHVGDICTDSQDRSFILLKHHPEYEELNELYSGQFGSFVVLESFVYTDKNGAEITVPAASFTRDINEFIISGYYTYSVTIPETTNYRAVSSIYTEEVEDDIEGTVQVERGHYEVQLHEADVYVYPSVASRKYIEQYSLDKEITYDDQRYVLLHDPSDILQYICYLVEGKIYHTLAEVPDGESPLEVFVYHETVDSETVYYDDVPYIFYVGIQYRYDMLGNCLNEPESMGSEDTLVSVDNLFYGSVTDGDGNIIDQAGVYNGMIQGRDGYKRNYKFNYSDFTYIGETETHNVYCTTLYVWKQVLVLDAELAQDADYSGRNVQPEFIVRNESGDVMEGGALALYVVGYYYYDGDGAMHVLVDRFDVSGEVSCKSEAVFASDYTQIETCDAYFYYVLEGEQIIIYKNGSSYFYYPQNNHSSSPVTLSEAIEIDFDNFGRNVNKVDTVDGKDIYMEIRENALASSNNDLKTLTDVFYYDGYTGGYFIRMQAEPNESAGCSPTNYSSGEYILGVFTVNVLDLLRNHDNDTPVTEFDGGYFIHDYIDQYFIGRGNVETQYNWGVVEPMYYYYKSYNGTELPDEYQANLFSGTSGWSIRQTYQKDSIVNAGAYILVLKATVCDGSLVDTDFEKDMTGNIRFVYDADNPMTLILRDVEYENSTYAQYFVLYLTRTRSKNITFGLATEGMAEDTDTVIDGVDGVYRKTYNGEAVHFGYTMNVKGINSNYGEVLPVTVELASDIDMKISRCTYLSTSRVFTEASVTAGAKLTENQTYLYHVFENLSGTVNDVTGDENWYSPYYSYSNNIYNVSNDVLFGSGKYYVLTSATNKYYNVTQINMTDAATGEDGISFYVRCLINSSSDNAYDNNYATQVLIFAVCISQRQLSVRVTTKEGSEEENAYKVYGQKNAEVEDKFTFVFDGWLEGEEDTVIPQSQYPIIDWSELPNDEWQRVGFNYHIAAKSGTGTVAPKNYIYVYNASLPFAVLQADSYVVVTQERPYAGAMQAPDMARYGLHYGNLDGEYGVYDPETGTVDMTQRSPDYSDTERYSSDKLKVTLCAKMVAPYWYKTEASDEKIYSFTSSGVLIADITESNFDTAFNWYSPARTQAYDAGVYLFKISLETESSANYKGFGDTYFIFEITKVELDILFTDGEQDAEGVLFRGYATKIYDKESKNYPNYNITYNGFVGADAELNGILQEIMYLRTSAESDRKSVQSALVNPFYVFVNGETGEELTDSGSNIFYPLVIEKDENENVVPYYIKLVFSEGEYGYSPNYNLKVNYVTDALKKTQYPIFEIQPREVRVAYAAGNADIVKVYDGTTAVNKNSVTSDSYSFFPTYVTDSFGRQTENQKSGLIEGDVITLDIVYNKSSYTRKDVYEVSYDGETGEQLFNKTKIVVNVYASDRLLGTDCNNYKIVWGETEGYVALRGVINQRSAEVIYYTDGTKTVQAQNKVTYEYNGESQPVYSLVRGVYREDLGRYEIISCKQLYESASEDTKYESETIAPKNCAEYKYSLTVRNDAGTEPNFDGSEYDRVTNMNYKPDTSSVSLVLTKATAKLTFGGDANQTYGSVSGLTAEATGIGGYTHSLTSRIAYYTSSAPQSGSELNFDLLTHVDNIEKESVGTYYAVADYEGDTNFKPGVAYEIFTIVRKKVNFSYNVQNDYSYTGQPIQLKVYFTYDNEEYTPSLIYNVIKDGLSTPVNYKIVDGEYVVSGSSVYYPTDVGKYQVMPLGAFGNFTIANATWISFSISKVKLLVTTENATLYTDETYTPSFKYSGNSLATGSASTIIGSNIKMLYYNSVSGEKLAGYPNEAGVYKVILDVTDIRSQNFEISAEWGTLILKNREIVGKVTETDATTVADVKGVKVEGIDSGDIVIKEETNIQYSNAGRTFNSYKETNTAFQGYYVVKVYTVDITNLTYTKTDDQKFNFKLTMPELVQKYKNKKSGKNAAWVAYAEEITEIDPDACYVAVLYNNGTMEIVEAVFDGDDVSIVTSSPDVASISILTDDVTEVTTSDGGTGETGTVTNDSSMDWLLYVCIAFGALLIVLSLIVVAKRAG